MVRIYRRMVKAGHVSTKVFSNRFPSKGVAHIHAVAKAAGCLYPMYGSPGVKKSCNNQLDLNLYNF